MFAITSSVCAVDRRDESRQISSEFVGDRRVVGLGLLTVPTPGGVEHDEGMLFVRP